MKKKGNNSFEIISFYNYYFICLFINSLIHSINQYVLSVCSVPGTGYTIVENTDSILLL